MDNRTSDIIEKIMADLTANQISVLINTQALAKEHGVPIGTTVRIPCVPKIYLRGGDEN